MFNVKRDLNLDVTTVSNKFITKFMPEAKGDYVKVYLYLLCASSSSNKEMNLDEIAQTLKCTPQFIIEALLYWEEIGIIEGAYNSSGELVQMTFLNDPEIESLDKRNELEETKRTRQELEKENEEIELTKQELGITEFGASKDINVPMDVARKLCEQDDVSMMLIAAESYLCHPLSASEVELFLYLYHSFNFSADLIEYLVEYCVQHKRTQTHMIRETANAWYANNIDSVLKAKNTTTVYNNEYRAICNALGIKRDLGEVEVEYFNKWLNEYPISIELIIEACSRTLLNIHKPEFRYVDTILRDWIDKGYKSVEEVRKSSGEPELKTPIVKATKSKNTKNSFSNFNQRDYSEEEANDMMVNKKSRLAKKLFDEVEEELVQQA